MSAGKIVFAAVQLDGAQIIGDGAIVGGGVFEGLGGEIKTCSGIDHTFIAFHFIDNTGVVIGIHDYGYGVVIFRRGTQHGGASDIDVFNGGG